MRALIRGSLALALAFAFTGCTYGIVYTHTVEPLTLNKHETPAGSTETQGDIKHIQLPAQLSLIGVAWGDAGLGEIAREHGVKELYYADLEYLSVLTIWRQYTVHLYGK